MATRAKRESPPADTRVAAMIPVNAAGDPVGDPENWQLQVGPGPGGPGPNDHDDIPLPDDDIVESAADRVASLLADVGSDASAKLTLYRLPNAGRKLTFLDEMTPEEFERGGLKHILAMWGGGEYEIRLYGQRSDTGKFGVRGRSQFTLEEPRTKAVVGGQSSELGQILAGMQQQQAELLRVLTERPAAPDPMVQMTGMLTMMKTMREAMGMDSQPKSPLADIVAAIRELKDVSAEINPAPEVDSPFGMVKSMLPLVQAAMEERARAQVPQQPMRQRLPAPRQNPLPAANVAPIAPPAQVPAVLEEQPTENEQEMIAQLKVQFAQLVELAKAHSTAPDDATKNLLIEQGADLVYEKLPDDLVEVLASDKWFEAMQMIDTGIGPYRAYFEVVRTAVLDEFQLDSQEGSDPPPAATAPTV